MEGLSRKRNNEKVDRKRRKLLGAGLAAGTTGALGLSRFFKGGRSRETEADLEKMRQEVKFEFFDKDGNPLDSRIDSSKEIVEDKKNETGEKVSTEAAHREDILANIEASEKAKEVAGLIIKYYKILSRTPNFFIPEIFTDEFFIADQIQESGYKTGAVSRSEAVGVMQTKLVAVLDVVESLYRFQRKNPEIFTDEIPPKISKEIGEEILEMIKKQPDLGRSVGKLYFASLFHRYGVGKKEFEAGDIEGAQKILLAAYNFGPRAKRVPEEQWPKETREYWQKVMAYKKEIERIKKESKEAGKEIDNYTAMLMASKLKIEI